MSPVSGDDVTKATEDNGGKAAPQSRRRPKISPSFPPISRQHEPPTATFRSSPLFLDPKRRENAPRFWKLLENLKISLSLPTGIYLIPVEAPKKGKKRGRIKGPRGRKSPSSRGFPQCSEVARAGKTILLQVRHLPISGGTEREREGGFGRFPLLPRF